MLYNNNNNSNNNNIKLTIIRFEASNRTRKFANGNRNTGTNKMNIQQQFDGGACESSAPGEEQEKKSSEQKWRIRLLTQHTLRRIKFLHLILSLIFCSHAIAQSNLLIECFNLTPPSLQERQSISSWPLSISKPTTTTSKIISQQQQQANLILNRPPPPQAQIKSPSTTSSIGSNHQLPSRQPQNAHKPAAISAIDNDVATIGNNFKQHQQKQLLPSTIDGGGSPHQYNKGLQSVLNKAQSRRQTYLPNGPPPYKPSMLVIGAASSGLVDKMKRTTAFKKVYRSKVYYLIRDILSQLTRIVDKISRKKIDLTSTKLETLQATFHKLAFKSGNPLKLKWPLVLLHPNLLKELLSNPTFLVMLFNAVEVAYMSMPHSSSSSWLKPLMKLIQQASPEKEEKIWWRRKRLYDTLNGHGSSELQPNLKTIHFRNPGKPTPVAFPNLVNLARKIAKKPSPNPAHYIQPTANSVSNLPRYRPVDIGNDNGEVITVTPVVYSDQIRDVDLGNNDDNRDHYMSHGQEEAFLSNQIKAQNHREKPQPTTLLENDWQIQSLDSNMMPDQSKQVDHSGGIKPLDYHVGDWLTHLPSQDQLMSQQEFDSLDPRDRELVIREAQQRFQESNWTNELIRQHSDYIESIVSPPLSSSHLDYYSLKNFDLYNENKIKR